MTETAEAAERQKVTDLSKKYAERGYEVLIAPRGKQLPPFLAGFSPDLIVRGPDENIVIEVKARGGENHDKDVERLARVIREQPGWHFRFVLVGKSDPEWQPPVTLPSTAAFRAGLDEVDALSRTGAQRAGALLLWSVIEGLLRRRLADRGFDPTERFDSGALLKQAVSEGHLDDLGYRQLRQLLALRNAMAHGFVQEHVSETDMHAARDIAARLLQPLAEPA